VNETDESAALEPLDLPPEVAAPAPQPAVHRFVFSGDTREYFRIWIVNLALGIATLGIYSAWAKVRTQRYFYSHTRLAGSPFEYLAQPLPILKGRIIAVVLFGGYLLAGNFMPLAAAALLVVISVLTPWLVVRGLMFRARYASWRGLTFRFVGDYSSAIRYFFLMYLLVPLTLGLIYPYVKFKQKEFIVANHRFGGKRFAFTDDTSIFFGPYVAAGVAVFGFVTAMAFLILPFMMSMVADTDPDVATARAELIGHVYIGLLYVVYFLAWTYLSARITNRVYAHASLDGNRFISTLRARDLMWIYASNTVAILASVGMLIPWAMIRLARYRAEHLAFVAHGDIDAFTTEATSDVGAAASEVDGLFDIDIGL
jgi:uncharacterized membrane protein YjgN (DUF898 family)